MSLSWTTTSVLSSLNLTSPQFHRLSQLRVLGLGCNQDRYVRVGVFPEREEILVGDAGFGGVALQGVGAGETEIRQRTDGVIRRYAAMVQDFLELGCGFVALMRGQIGFSSHKNGVQGGPTVSAGQS